eukprot:378586-Amphidinium_carterae.1
MAVLLGSGRVYGDSVCGSCQVRRRFVEGGISTAQQDEMEAMLRCVNCPCSYRYRFKVAKMNSNSSSSIENCRPPLHPTFEESRCAEFEQQEFKALAAFQSSGKLLRHMSTFV